jgi:hypothetical protein
MTNNKVGISGRMVLTVLLFIILIAALCTVSTIFTQIGVVGPRRTAVLGTRTQTVQFGTQTADAMTKTAAAFTSTPTNTATLTPTATNTPIPTVVSCLATVISPLHVNLYAFPGGGRGGDVVLVRTGSTVYVTAAIDDHAWYQITTSEGATGWMRADYLSLLPGCIPNTYDLAFILNLLTGNKQPILEDTFSSNKSTWVNAKGEIIYPVEESEPDDYKLVLSSPYELMTARWQDAPADLKPFELTTSWGIIPNDIPAYVAFRFLINGPDYYEVRILRDCSVEVYETEKFFIKHVFDAEDKACADGRSDFVTISLDSSYTLGIQINDSGKWETQVEDPNGIYAKGSGLELVAYKAKVSFEWIVITKPK